MFKSAKYSALTVIPIVSFLALGLPSFIGDGSESFPDVRREIVNEAITSARICFDHPLHRMMIRRSRLIHLAYTEVPEEEREPFVIPSPLPALLEVPRTYTIDEAILRHFSFFAIPLGYSRSHSRGVDCDARVDLNAL